MYPSLEIPKLEQEKDAWVEKMAHKENTLYAHTTGIIKQTTFAIFSDNDELFSYKDIFDQIYGTDSIKGMKNAIIVEGTHHIPPKSLETGLAAAMVYAKNFESVAAL